MASKTRERLIEVARQLFVRKGVDNITISDIANASDKGRRTIYTYFKSKKEIYAAVVDAESERIVKVFREIAESDASAEDKLVKFLGLHLEKNSPAANAYGMMKSLLKFDSRRIERIRITVQEKEQSLIDDILNQGISEGVFDQTKTKMLSSFVMRTLYSMAFTDDLSAKTVDANRNFIEFILSNLKVK